MVMRTYNFPEKLWKRFEMLRIRTGVRRKQEFFLLVVKKGLQVIEEEIKQKEK